MIIRGGENIFPARIENQLATRPAPAQIAVLGVEDEYYGEKAAAVIRLSSLVSATDLTVFCNDRIAKFKTPAVYYRVAGYPLNASGKIRNVDLRQMAESLEVLQ